MPTVAIEQPKRTSPREAARVRKQRQRERQRERARLAAEAAAKEQEKQDERLAPKVLREAIVTLGGRMLVGPRVQIVNGRAMRSTTLNDDPFAKTKTPVITDEHKRAARQLQLDWYDVGAGIGVGAVDYLRSGGGGDGSGGHDAIMAQVAARGRLEGAMAHLGAYAPSIARVVLDGIPIAAWAAEPDPFGIERTAAEGAAWIAGGLSRLAGFYWPPAEVRAARVRTFGPSRGAYSVEVEGDEAA